MIKNTLDNPKLKAETFKARFLEAAVVEYQDERVLIKPENLLKIALKFKGAKVIVDHKEVTSENSNEIVGYINNVWIGDDGWAWCDFTVNDGEAVDLINRGYSVSCCYIGVASGSGGTKNAVPYDREIIDIEDDDEVTHLAIVENPRYEDAIILQNSIKNKMKNIFKFTKKSEVKENSVKELEIENSAFEIDGEEISVSKLMESYKNAKKNEDEEKDEPKVNADDEFEIDGKMIKVSEMVKSYKASKKNEEDEAKKNEEEKEMKEDEKKKEAKKNSADVEKITKDKAKYENGAAIKEIQVITNDDRFALGAAIYGSPQKITN